MRMPSHHPRSGDSAVHVRLDLRGAAVVALAALVALFASTSIARADVGLGSAEGFAILAGQSVSNTGPTTIYGDIGIHPGATDPPANITGGASITQTGTIHDGDDVASAAKADLVIAYDDAAGRPVTATISRELDGEDLGPGVYASTEGDFLLSTDGVLTLTGDADSVWIFKSGSELLFESGSEVVLVGADPCNVFWQVTSSARLGTDSVVVGTIMALTSIVLETDATLEGRALARNGSVTLDSNTITIEPCTAGLVEPEAEAQVEESVAEEAVPVETPTRVDTGRGSDRRGMEQGALVLLAVATIGAAVMIGRRRRQGS